MADIYLNATESGATLIGELTRHTIEQLNSTSFSQLFDCDLVAVDLAQLSKVDTAGLAWLFHLLELSGNAGCQLSFSHLPNKLHKLIELSGVDGFLPLAAD